MIFSREFFFYPHKISSFIDMRLFENLKATILKSIITWSVMGQQNAQAKKVYSQTQFPMWAELIGHSCPCSEIFTLDPEVFHPPQKPAGSILSFDTLVWYKNSNGSERNMEIS